jgi:hypothetical protein
MSFAPSLENSTDAARPMPLPAPVMTTDLPSRRPMSFSLIVMRAGVCRLAEFKQDFKRPRIFAYQSHLRRCVL